tara:strand:- start:7116 stop:8159 length:1044 start_codon:yes stop_codon:yes gene_type:complete
MKILSRTLLGALLLLGCSEKEKSAATGTTKGEAIAKNEIPTSENPTVTDTGTDTIEKMPAAAKGLPLAKTLDCESVVTKFITAFVTDDADARKAEMLTQCESDWTAPFRECVQSATSKHAPLTCEVSVKPAECKLAFERLGALAKFEGKDDPSLSSKADAMTEPCMDLKNASRKCLLEAATLDAYQACPGTKGVAAVVASAELGWAASGLDSWDWPEFFKGQAAERLSVTEVVIDSESVRPTLRIACDSAALKVSIWTKVNLDDGGKNASKLSLSLKLDDQAESKTEAKVEMAEHIRFASPDKFAESLQGHKTLHVAFEGPGKTPVAIDFGITGVEEVLAKLGTCNE